jgi:uroporphyrinogen decarboxylase
MNDLMIRACRREPCERTPVWMMRQAGRYLKEYRSIRSEVSFLDLCKTPELAAEVSLQPYRILGVDAVIFFSDILIPVEGMGLEVRLTDKGPEIGNPVRTASDIERLSVPDCAEAFPFTRDVLRILRRELEGGVPLIGFAGAPWTLGAYMVEGGGSKSFALMKGMAFGEPQLAHDLMNKLSDVIASYLLYQIDSGAQVVQLFDTWAGELSPRDYEEFALPYVQKIFEAVGDKVPRILYLNGTTPLLESMVRSGADVLSVDWRIPIGDARKRVGDGIALQGNLDPCLLLGRPEHMLARTAEILDAGGPRGHILNLGHGILPSTPVENARAFVEFAKTYHVSPAAGSAG